MANNTNNDLMNILKASIKKVPANKYALGVLGLVAVVVIARYFNFGFSGVSLKALLWLFFSMVILYVFSIMVSANMKDSILPTLLSWVVSVILSLSLLFLMSSFFFDYPKPIIDYPMFSEGKLSERIKYTITVCGTITDEGGNGIEGATFNLLGFKEVKTNKDGEFSIEVEIYQKDTIFQYTASAVGYKDGDKATYYDTSINIHGCDFSKPLKLLTKK